MSLHKIHKKKQHSHERCFPCVYPNSHELNTFTPKLNITNIDLTNVYKKCKINVSFLLFYMAIVVSVNHPFQSTVLCRHERIAMVYQIFAQQSFADVVHI